MTLLKKLNCHHKDAEDVKKDKVFSSARLREPSALSAVK